MNLDQLSVEFIKKDLLQEHLIISDVGCHQQVLAAFSKLLEKKSNDFAALTETQSKVISLGGLSKGQRANDVYNLQGQALTRYPDLPMPMHNHCSLALNNFIYCMGGKAMGTSKTLNDVWRLSLKSEKPQWNRISSMNQKRRGMGSTVHKGSLVVAGGRSMNSVLGLNLDSVELYDLESDKWSFIPSMQQRRNDNALVSCEGKLYALGGSYGRLSLNSVERLEDFQRQWDYVKSMQHPRCMFAAVNCNGKVYAIGGVSHRTTLKSVERYDPDANCWCFVKEMDTARSGHSACVLNGKIYVVGGADDIGSEKFNLVQKIDCYDPANDKWSVVGATDDALIYHSTVAA